MHMCPGVGEQKAKRLHDALHAPFIAAKDKKQKRTEPNISEM